MLGLIPQWLTQIPSSFIPPPVSLGCVCVWKVDSCRLYPQKLTKGSSEQSDHKEATDKGLEGRREGDTGALFSCFCLGQSLRKLYLLCCLVWTQILLGRLPLDPCKSQVVGFGTLSLGFPSSLVTSSHGVVCAFLPWDMAGNTDTSPAALHPG